MLASARIVVDKKAVGRLLRSQELADEMEGRGIGVANALGPGFEAEVMQGFDRVSVIIKPVTPEAIAAVRADSSVLTRGMDAARG